MNDNNGSFDGAKNILFLFYYLQLTTQTIKHTIEQHR